MARASQIMENFEEPNDTSTNGADYSLHVGTLEITTHGKELLVCLFRPFILPLGIPNRWPFFAGLSNRLSPFSPSYLDAMKLERYESWAFCPLPSSMIIVLSATKIYYSLRLTATLANGKNGLAFLERPFHPN